MTRSRRGPETVTTIEIGTRVRSFDFSFGFGEDDGLDLTGERACFVTGIVTGILKAGELAEDGVTAFGDCDRYIIRAESRTFRGEDYPLKREGQNFFPPVNGTETTMGNTCAGVLPFEIGLLEAAEDVLAAITRTVRCPSSGECSFDESHGLEGEASALRIAIARVKEGA